MLWKIEFGDIDFLSIKADSHLALSTVSQQFHVRPVTMAYGSQISLLFQQSVKLVLVSKHLFVLRFKVQFDQCIIFRLFFSFQNFLFCCV